MRQEGLIRHIGLSNVTVDQLHTATQIVEIAAVTAHFNVVARDQATLLDAALAADAVFVPWQPVSLTTPGVRTDANGPEAARRVIELIAARHGGATIPQIALAWLLTRAPAILPIPATTSIDHLRTNLAAQHLDLSSSDIEAIDALGPGDDARSAK